MAEIVPSRPELCLNGNQLWLLCSFLKVFVVLHSLKPLGQSDCLAYNSQLRADRGAKVGPNDCQRGSQITSKPNILVYFKE
jgi:hypothetical protein